MDSSLRREQLEALTSRRYKGKWLILVLPPDADEPMAAKCVDEGQGRLMRSVVEALTE